MFLIEMLSSETLNDVQAFLEALIVEVYGPKPAWLEYDLNEIYRFKDRKFIRLFCLAGSVHARLALHAKTGDGISRDILLLGTRSGLRHAFLIHHGQEFEHASEEVQAVE